MLEGIERVLRGCLVMVVLAVLGLLVLAFLIGRWTAKI